MVRKAFYFGFAAALASASLAAPAISQTATAGAAGTRTEVLQPEALAALDRMGAYLRSLQTFQLISNATSEDVFPNGQKLLTMQRTTYTLGGKDKLHVKIEADGQLREAFFDGTTFTLLAPRIGKFLQIPATGSVSAMLTRAYQEWGLEFPAQDLFRWGTVDATAEKPSEGFKVGAVRIGETMTDHYAFRQAGVDWQIWIDQGDKPLPRKLVITSLEDPAQPQFISNFNWNTAPDTMQRTFTFTAAPGDVKIDIKQLAAATK